jgi:LacI family transcriptional regulator
VTHRVTLADVARRAGLSPTAASLILNNRPSTRLSEEAVQRVRRAAEELGYRPNAAARTLSTRTSRTLGFLSSDVATTRFAGALILGAMRRARELDHVLLIVETLDVEEDEGVATLLDRQVDGVLMAATRSHTVRVPTALDHTPVVLLNLTAGRGTTQVLPDERRAGHEVARALLAAGHRQGTALVGAPLAARRSRSVSVAVRRRLAGIADAFGDDAPVAEVGFEPWEPEAGYDAVTRLLRDGPAFTALLCLNDRLAIGAYQALQEAGVRIPGDVSVAAFDDDEAARFLRPRLTTAALPHEEMGRLAVDLLLTPRPAAEHLVPLPLRERDSIGPVRGS